MSARGQADLMSCPAQKELAGKVLKGAASPQERPRFGRGPRPWVQGDRSGNSDG
jgi:hypothetical protein